jgi:signal transduction histidine kinase
MVRGNETLLIQVLQNLIVNALHYNQSAVPRAEVLARSDGESWVIEVRDNGIGIAAEYLTEIFKPLIRLHTASEYPGSGLGLTLARKAILSQKGEIWCESTPGQGTAFHIRLPAAEGRRESKRKKPTPGAGAEAGADRVRREPRGSASSAANG